MKEGETGSGKLDIFNFAGCRVSGSHTVLLECRNRPKQSEWAWLCPNNILLAKTDKIGLRALVADS